MNKLLKYFIPIAFTILGGYYLWLKEWIEGSLYISIAMAFPIMWALRDGKIKSNIRFWNAFSWGLVIVALLLFLLLLRLDGREGL